MKLKIIAAGVALASCAAFADQMTPKQVAKAFVESLMNCKINAMGKYCTEDSQDYFELNKATFKKNVMNMNLEGTQTYKILDTKQGLKHTFVCVQNEKNEKDVSWVATKEDCGAWLVDLVVTCDRIWNNPNAKPIPTDLLPAPAVAAPAVGPDKVAIRFFKAVMYKDQKRCETFIATAGRELFNTSFKGMAEAMSEGENPEDVELFVKDLKINGDSATLMVAKKGEEGDDIPLTLVIENGEWRIDWLKLIAKAMEESEKDDEASAK